MSVAMWQVTVDVVPFCFWLFLSYVVLEKKTADSAASVLVASALSLIWHWPEMRLCRVSNTLCFLAGWISNGAINLLYYHLLCRRFCGITLHIKFICSMSFILYLNQTMDPALFFLGINSPSVFHSTCCRDLRPLLLHAAGRMTLHAWRCTHDRMRCT